jgi:AbrB family looped-hinge helix DNA binding protein
MNAHEEMPGCCRMEAVVTVDQRGQIVLPKDLRERAGIGKGDKLMVVACEQQGKVCCITLMRTEDSEGFVKELMGPMLKGFFKGDMDG